MYSTRNAAVAAAASAEAFGKLRFTRYGFPWRSTALTAPYTAPCAIATKMLPAFGADVSGGCAFTVLTAISFHFVTSLACATAGTASARTPPKTASRPNRADFMPASLSTPVVSSSASFPFPLRESTPAESCSSPSKLMTASGVSLPSGAIRA